MSGRHHRANWPVVPTPSDLYDESYFDAPHLVDLDSPFQRYRARMVLGLHSLRPTDRVLDLGCGWGTISFAAALTGVRHVVGLDSSEHAIALCEKRNGPGGPTFVVGDATDMVFPDDEFTLVYAADLFEHLYPDDSRLVAKEAFRILEPGGRFVVWVPCRSHVIEVLKNRNIILKRLAGHVDYKSMRRMKAILENAGFEIEVARYAESHLPGLRILERVFQRWVPLLRRRIGMVAKRP